MTTKTSHQLMEKLRSELPKKAAKPKGTTDDRRLPVSSAAGNGGAQRVSITIYPADFKRLNEIKHVMLQQGVRTLNDSVAIRAALRTVALDPSLLRKAYDAMILEDKRRS